MQHNIVPNSRRPYGRHWASVLAVLAALIALGAPACNRATDVAAGLAAEDACHQNSDCASGLLCALGACRTMCASAADCGSGGACVDNGYVAVCQSLAEKNEACDKQSDCPAPLACASDYRCRNLCNTTSDCNVLGITGRICAKDAQGVYYCGDTSEVVDGVLVASPPAGAPKTPVVEPSAGVGVLAAPDAAVSIESVIGPAGGTLGIGPAAITIPPGALADDLTIPIRPVASPVAGATGQVFEIEPSGTQFTVPATVTLSYANVDLGGSSPGVFAVGTVVGAVWQALPGQILDVTAQTIPGTTTHLSPYALVAQGASTTLDAGAAPDATVEMAATDASTGGLSTGGGLDGGGAGGSGGFSNGDGGGGTSSGSGPTGCASAPAAAVSPAGSASGTNVVASQGATINIQDGFAQITQQFTSGALNTTYTTSLYFYFTDYANALGYAEVGAVKEGSRTLGTGFVNEDWTSLTSSTAQPEFAAGTYSLDVGVVEISGYTASCQGQDQTIEPEGTLTISSITSTRIQGSIVGTDADRGPGADAGAITIDFDIPLIDVSDGGSLLNVDSSRCCLP